ncbi:MAG: phosphoribosyltransferase family protein [Euryarchaeota archaeon]|nr:phosphoribosyltransferase family protein [Euryarchaeota archaeon]
MKNLEKKLQAVEYLRYLKEDHTYREISEKFGLPITVLNRYISGRNLPGNEKMKLFLRSYNEDFDLKEEVRGHLVFNGEYFDNTRLLYNTFLLRRVARYCTMLFEGVDKVFTSAIDGIPLAGKIADAYNVNMVFAKQKKEVGVKKFLEESYIPSSSGNIISLYLPKNAIRRREDVLIVDDVIRSGETQRALINLVKRSGARVCGIFVIIAVKKEGLRMIKDENLKVLIEL